MTDLVAAGFGRDAVDIAGRLTWRQIKAYYKAVQHKRDRDMADQVEAAAIAYAGGDINETIEKLRNGRS